MDHVAFSSDRGIQECHVRLIVTEKNLAAQKIAELLSDTKATTDKVYNTPVYRFKHQGVEQVAIGLRGHILEVDFVESLRFADRTGWYGLDAEGNQVDAHIPDELPRPPFKKRKPFVEDGVELKAWKVAALPYLTFAPLQKTPAEKEIIRSLKNLAKKADEIVIATDFDREGELIGSDAIEMVRDANQDAPIKRARYSAIVKSEIEQAFDELVTLDENLAQAGESRRFIDLIWGAVLTRYLTMAKFSGFGNTRSSGRVQTPTLALLVHREREREAFVPEDYWVIKGHCAQDEASFDVTHATARFSDETLAQAAFAAVEGATQAQVTAVDKKKRSKAAPVPFNTTSLQAAAAAEGLTPGRTMRLAESLYMDGLISYPRVDNTVYPASLELEATLKVLTDVPAYAPYARGLLARGKLTATRGKTETTDHPPIYPTGAGDPDKLRGDEWKLYNLIARRFMATLSGPSTVEGTTVRLDVTGQPFVAKGDVIVTAGYTEIYPYGLKKEEHLPALVAGDQVAFSDPVLLAKQTEPPSRYSQGGLIQEMEKHGLGTKSTRHSTIDRLIEVKYVSSDPLAPTRLGCAIIDALEKYAPVITRPEMTSELEREMDAIVAGNNTRAQVVDDSRRMLGQIIEKLVPLTEEVGAVLADAVTADSRVGACPKCGKDLLMKSSAKTRSMFIGCSGWPDCDVTYPVPQGKINPVEEPCPVCGSPQIQVIAFRTKPRIVCVDPACSTNYEPDLVVGECAACHDQFGKTSKLIAQKNPRTLKRFIRCENHEECGTSYPLPQNGKLTATGEYCESCGAPLVTVTTHRGPWKLCPNYACPAREEKEAKKKTGKGASKKKPAKKTKE
jgi:DNA topoisomerase I